MILTTRKPNRVDGQTLPMALEALEVEPRSILIVRHPSFIESTTLLQVLEYVDGWLEGAGLRDVMVVVAAEGVKVETVTEAELKQAGWVRGGDTMREALEKACMEFARLDRLRREAAKDGNEVDPGPVMDAAREVCRVAGEIWPDEVAA